MTAIGFALLVVGVVLWIAHDASWTLRNNRVFATLTLGFIGSGIALLTLGVFVYLWRVMP